MTSLESWNDRTHETCDLCRAVDMNAHLWRIYIGKELPTFILALCVACHRAIGNHEDAENIIFGLGLHIKDELKRRLPEPQFSKAWAIA